MAPFLADEDFDHRIAIRLRMLGHDVLTLAVLGLAGRCLTDDQVLATAASERRAVLTHNRLHFVRLHRRMPQHAGIVISSHVREPIAQAKRIEAVLRTLPISLAASSASISPITRSNKSAYFTLRVNPPQRARAEAICLHAKPAPGAPAPQPGGESRNTAQARRQRTVAAARIDPFLSTRASSHAEPDSNSFEFLRREGEYELLCVRCDFGEE